MADAKQGKAASEDLYNGTAQSRVILAKPRLGGFGSPNFASSSNKSCNPFGSVLRPPQLKAKSNPFYKHAEVPDEIETGSDKKTETVAVDRLQDKKEVETPKFVPLASGGATSRASNPVPTPAQPANSTSSSGFVFGQNLSDRVVMVESLNNGEATSTDHSTSNGTMELLFTNAAASVKETVQEEAESIEKSGEGLAAAAAEYERSHARPLPPTSNCTMTGEEDETNVLQITCRLFAWEAGSWRERGRGVLRLNDAAGGGNSSGSSSRLVVRVAGSLRVILNTKLWPDMVVERAGAKSLRITAVDAQLQIKLYLIMGEPCNIVQLYRALTARVSGSKRTLNCTQNSTSQRAAERLEAATDDGDYMDKPDDAYNDDSCYKEDKQTPETDKGSVLRPPQLKVNIANLTPIHKYAEVPDEIETESEKKPDTVTVNRLQDKKQVETPKFVPLASSGVTSKDSNPVPTPAKPATSTSSSGFVFGQNLSERVVMVEPVNNGEATSADRSTSNGTTELLFTNAAASVKETMQEEAGSSERSGEGLAAAAAEYERSHARPPPPVSNCTMTGEEDETNVLQITCRLFAWEAGSWRERGRGVLRLNDAAGGGNSSGSSSRLVVRVAGSLRVILNTKLWPDMVVERAGAKSLRITAVDAQLQIKLYLIMGDPCNIVQLYRALATRVAGSKRTLNCTQNSTSQRAAERLEAATDDGDYIDKSDDAYNDDSCYKEEKQTSESDEDAEITSPRLEKPQQQTDEHEAHKNIADNEEVEKDKALKRKEPADDVITPKRQCPEIIIQRP